MRRLALTSLAISFSLGAAAPARAVDTQGPIVCALVDVFDCSTGDCVEVTSESVAVPDVMRIDPAKKTATALDTEFHGAASPLESVGIEGAKVIARGREGERIFVLSIESASGDSIATVSDPKTTLVMYGECVEP